MGGSVRPVAEPHDLETIRQEPWHRRYGERAKPANHVISTFLSAASVISSKYAMYTE